MAQLMGFLSSLVSIYMMILFFRIILSWFSWMREGPFQNFLAKVTDPYLNWFRRFPLRFGFLDLTPILALATLSLVNRLFATLAHHQTISVGIILAMIVQMIWGIASFLLGFLAIVFALRLVAYLARFNIYNPFWRIVDTIYQPVSYKINRALFKGRIVNFSFSIIVSIAGMLIAYVGLSVFVRLASGILAGLPL